MGLRYWLWGTRPCIVNRALYTVRSTRSGSGVINSPRIIMNSQETQVLELTCEKQEGKKVAVLSDSIVAAIISQKSGAAATGRAAGFFSATAAE